MSHPQRRVHHHAPSPCSPVLGGAMIVTLDIPDEIAVHLTAPGQEISRSAMEALAVEGYRSRKLTQFQVGQLLGLSRIQTEDFLAGHVDLYDYSMKELEAEAELLRNFRHR